MEVFKFHLSVGGLILGAFELAAPPPPDGAAVVVEGTLELL
jgi:hypothetical protein